MTRQISRAYHIDISNISNSNYNYIIDACNMNQTNNAGGHHTVDLEGPFNASTFVGCPGQADAKPMAPHGTFVLPSLNQQSDYGVPITAYLCLGPPDKTVDITGK
jgi:hypothetical protein